MCISHPVFTTVLLPSPYIWQVTFLDKPHWERKLLHLVIKWMINNKSDFLLVFNTSGMLFKEGFVKLGPTAALWIGHLKSYHNYGVIWIWLPDTEFYEASFKHTAYFSLLGKFLFPSSPHPHHKEFSREIINSSSVGNVVVSSFFFNLIFPALLRYIWQIRSCMSAVYLPAVPTVTHSAQAGSYTAITSQSPFCVCGTSTHILSSKAQVHTQCQ